jgi:hypothetical protein
MLLVPTILKSSIMYFRVSCSDIVFKLKNHSCGKWMIDD